MVALVKAPSVLRGTDGDVIVVTSGAGTGKTSTLQAVARRLHDLGHVRVAYVTFSAAGARDAARRLEACGVECRTIDAQALACVAAKYGQGGGEGAGRLLTDNELEALIRSLCSAEIEQAVKGVASPRARAAAARTITSFIEKTLERFLQSDEGEAGLATNLQKAERWHREGKVEGIARSAGDLYVRCAKRVYERVRPGAVLQEGEEAVVTFASVMKAAQHEDIQINATAILVDECQDCNRAQLKWLVQHRAARQLFFVGDTAQRIYGFRGAQPQALLGLPNTITRRLTHCFRFGAEIAAVANIVLFAKEMSKQAGWSPYRLTGRGGDGKVVSSCGVLPRTVLACHNVTLLKRGMELFAESGGKLRIAINGASQGSGQQRWVRSFELVRQLFQVYKGSVTELPADDFPEFAGDEGLTWDALCKAVRERQLGRFTMALSIVNKFKQDTLDVIESFETGVLRAEHSAATADILLSTVHAAKGMEWDTVEVLDDVIELAAFRAFDVGRPSAGFRATELIPGSPLLDCLVLLRPGDDINLLYVAVTRARRVLCVPKSISHMVIALRNMHAIDAACAAGLTRVTIHLALDDGATLAIPPNIDTPTFFWPPFLAESTAKDGVTVASRRYSQLFSVEQVRRLHRELGAPWASEGQEVQIAPVMDPDDEDARPTPAAKRPRT